MVRDDDQVALDHVSLDVHKGEIVGIAGVAGNGQRRLARALAGIETPAEGTVVIGGVDVTGHGALAARRAGLAFVPEDRLGTGLVPDLSLTDNMLLTRRRAFFVDRKTARADAEQGIDEYEIKAPGTEAEARVLSGGNAQKVLLARELAHVGEPGGPQVVIVSSPTRGLDVGAAEFVRGLLHEARERGAAVLVISEDLDEVRSLADRIAVLYRGAYRARRPRRRAPSRRDRHGDGRGRSGGGALMGYTVQLERRLSTNWKQAVFTPILSVLAALVAGAVFLLIEGFDPISVYRELFDASFTSKFGITDTLTIAVPLILTGLAAAVVFRMNLFNIGAEGQLYLGAIFGSWAGLAFTDGLPTVAGVGVVLVFAAIGGAVWALPAALFKAFFGTSEIITTLMLTFIALFLMRYLIFGSNSYWRDPETTNFPQGKRVPVSARFELFGDTRLHWGIVVALGIVVLVWVLIRFTSLGFDMNVVGSSTASAAYAGISTRRTVIVALLLSGALGGLAGGAEVAGRAYALDPNGLELGLGFTGIVVAALARYNPFGIVIVATFIAGLRNGGIALQGLPGERVPVEVSLMLQGAILLCAIGGDVFARNRLRLVRTAPQGVESAS